METIISEMSQDELRKMIFLMFDGYLDRKRKNMLYTENDIVPELIIQYYYSYLPNPVFSNIYDKFREEYIDNEEKIENELKNNFHSAVERRGLGKVYDFIQTYVPTKNLNIFLLIKLQKILFSETEYPDFAGNFRQIPVYLPGSGVDIVPFDQIGNEMARLYAPSNLIVDEGFSLGEEKNSSVKSSKIIEYIKKCVSLNCQLIKIHPFNDGNGRTIRAYTNLLFKLADIPPVYIEYSEQEEYRKAMNKAIGDEGDLSDIITFYLYKVCDSIIRLDIGYSSMSKKVNYSLFRNVDELLYILNNNGKSRGDVTSSHYNGNLILMDNNSDDYIICYGEAALEVHLGNNKQVFHVEKFGTYHGNTVKFHIDGEFFSREDFQYQLSMCKSYDNKKYINSK